MPAAELLQTVAPHQLDRCLICLGAAVAEKSAIGEGVAAQLAGQFRLGQDVVEIRNVQQLFRLLPNRPDNSRMTVTQIVDCDSGEKVEVLFTVGIPDFRPFASNQGDRNAGIGTSDIFVG
jgi:hypothetical protein